MKGSCLCGKITYSVKRFIPHTTHCHCSMCRKFHGAAFATYSVATHQDFQWLSGEALLSRYQAANGTVRSFCRHCGSSLCFESKQSPDTIDIALATLDEPTNEKPSAHIYTDSKASWYNINDDIPCYAQQRK